MLAVLLADGKISVMRKWLKAEPPATERFEIAYQIYVMEKVSIPLQIKKRKIWIK